MTPLSTEHFSDWTGGRWTKEPPGEVKDFCIDTRKLEAGQMFVAIQTENRDGHDFLENARAAGAVAALVSRETSLVDLPQLVVSDTEKALRELAIQQRMEFSGKAIGITGSCGKTSTKELLALLLGAGTVKTPGNFNNHLGVPLTLLHLRKDDKYAVVEVGMNAPGEIPSLARILQPDYSVVTTVAPVHLEGVGSLQGVAEEKAALVRAARKLSVLPVQCFRFPAFSKLRTPCLIAGKPEPGRDYPASSRFVDYNIDQSPKKTDVVLRYKDGKVLSFSVTRISNGMAGNMVLCIILCLELGLPSHDLQSRLENWRSASLRCERVKLGELDFFIDCYNANPSSMRDSLEYFNSITPEDKPRYYVIGGMKELGEYTEEYHRELGRSFKLRSQDRLYLTGIESTGFLAGFRAAGRNEEHVKVFRSNQEVVKELRPLEGSVFLKGSRSYALEEIFNKLKELHVPLQTTC